MKVNKEKNKNYNKCIKQKIQEKINTKGVKKMKVIDKIALDLIVIGAINWGLVGIFKFNLVDTLFGSMSALTRIIYALVGISGLWGIKLLFDD